MLGKIILLFLFPFLIIGQTITLADKYAFPSAIGFGQNATGGDGGTIIEVTNLNASGSGSLKSALESTGARIVIFRVGGTIDLANSRLYLNNPNITIAGETAPGGGILIANGSLVIQTNNVIIRHLRIRGSYTDDDCIRIKPSGSGTLSNIILDHVSVSWGKDGNIDISNGLNVTVQNSLISKNTRSNLINFDSKNISYIQNIFALVDQRVLRANTIGHLDLTYEMINNYLYGVNIPGGPSQGLKTTTENNVCEKSNDFSISSSFLIDNIPPNPDNGEPNTIENSYYYAAGNDIGDAYLYQLRPTIASQYIFDVPLYRSTYTPLPTIGLKAKLLADTGAGILTSQGLDSHDVGIISNINSKTGTVGETGTFPTIANGTPYPDSNNDGISDTWATTHGITSASQIKSTYTIGGKTIINDAGYTALEIFLAELAGDFDRLPLDSPSGVPVITLLGSNPMHLQVGQPYNEPGATATNTSNSVNITGTVNTSEAGTYYRYYNVSNEAGAAEQKVRTVIVSDSPQPGTRKGFNRNILLTLD